VAVFARVTFVENNAATAWINKPVPQCLSSERSFWIVEVELKRPFENSDTKAAQIELAATIVLNQYSYPPLGVDGEKAEVHPKV
jgi:hypothetical protein